MQTGRPGHRLPHAWLERFGQRVGTHDLLRIGMFLVVAGSEGGAWCDAADALASELGMEIDHLCIGPRHQLRDREGTWPALRGHGEGGVLLVRPDGHVAYRASEALADPRAALQGALAVALGRRIAATA